MNKNIHNKEENWAEYIKSDRCFNKNNLIVEEPNDEVEFYAYHDRELEEAASCCMKMIEEMEKATWVSPFRDVVEENKNGL